MSRKQTRASVSLERDLGVELYAFAEANGTSASQVAMRGIRAVLSGEIALGETIDPRQLGIRTADKRRGLTAEQMAARLRQRDKDRTRHDSLRRRRAEQAARELEVVAPVVPEESAKTKFVRLAVSDPTASLIDDQLERHAAVGLATTDGEVLEAGINRMLDALQVQIAAGALCKHCLETDLCRCNGHRQAVGR